MTESAPSWYLFRDGRQEGPFTAAGVREQLAAGAATPDTHAWRAGMKDWRPLRTLPLFAGAIRVPAPVPTTPSVTTPVAPAPAPAQTASRWRQIAAVLLIMGVAGLAVWRHLHPPVRMYTAVQLAAALAGASQERVRELLGPPARERALPRTAAADTFVAVREWRYGTDRVRLSDAGCELYTALLVRFDAQGFTQPDQVLLEAPGSSDIRLAALATTRPASRWLMAGQAPVSPPSGVLDQGSDMPSGMYPVIAGTPLPFSVRLPAWQARTAHTCRWTVVAAPPGGNGYFQPADREHTEFLATVTGMYTLRFSATEQETPVPAAARSRLSSRSERTLLTCEFSVQVLPPHAPVPLPYTLAAYNRTANVWGLTVADTHAVMVVPATGDAKVFSMPARPLAISSDPSDAAFALTDGTSLLQLPLDQRAPSGYELNTACAGLVALGRGSLVVFPGAPSDVFRFDLTGGRATPLPVYWPIKPLHGSSERFHYGELNRVVFAELMPDGQAVLASDGYRLIVFRPGGAAPVITAVSKSAARCWPYAAGRVLGADGTVFDCGGSERSFRPAGVMPGGAAAVHAAAIDPRTGRVAVALAGEVRIIHPALNRSDTLPLPLLTPGWGRPQPLDIAQLAFTASGDLSVVAAMAEIPRLTYRYGIFRLTLPARR